MFWLLVTVALTDVGAFFTGKAIGKTKFQLAVKNVFPHLLPEIVVLFFLEIARVLTLMMQLGIFGVFVGNVRIVDDSGWYGYKYVNLPYEP